jgi:hypothetical protein
LASVAKTTGRQHVVREVVAVDDDDTDADDDTSSVNAEIGIGGTVDLDPGASSPCAPGWVPIIVVLLS